VAATRLSRCSQKAIAVKFYTAGVVIRFYIFLKRLLTFTERPARRLLLIVLHPLWVRIRALKPLFLNFLILLLRWFSISISYMNDDVFSFIIAGVTL
jgi:hypothetical protein